MEKKRGNQMETAHNWVLGFGVALEKVKVSCHHQETMLFNIRTHPLLGNLIQVPQKQSKSCKSTARYPAVLCCDTIMWTVGRYAYDKGKGLLLIGKALYHSK